MIAAAAIASAALSFTSPAPATLHGDLDAAAAYWGQSVPAQCSSEAAAFGKLPGLVLGQTKIPDPTATEPCEMVIERGLTKRLRCLTVVHEYGHWLGLGHAKSKRSPMYPVIGDGAVVPECEHP